MPFATYASLVITTFFWGGTFIAGRMLAGAVPPVSASFLRFAIASAALLVMLLVSGSRPVRPKPGQIIPLLLLGLTGVFAYNLFFFTGLTYISAGRASLIIALTPLAITIFSTILFREALTPLKSCGILLSVGGALFVISNGHPAMLLSGGFGAGEAALLGCVLSWSAYTLIGRSVLRSMSAMNSVFYSSVAGTLMLLVPALLEGLPELVMQMGPQQWASLAYLGICGTAIGFSLYYRAIGSIGTIRAGVFINLVPVFALLLSWLLLAESLKISVIAGGITVLSGIYLANRATAGPGKAAALSENKTAPQHPAAP